MRTREPGSDIKRGPGGGPSRGARMVRQVHRVTLTNVIHCSTNYCYF